MRILSIIAGPFLILTSIILLVTGFMHIGAVNIKVFDRKMTSQHFNFKGGDYNWDEVRRNLSWEDGLIGFNVDYNDQLQKDLTVAAQHIEGINAISWEHLTFQTPDYEVKLCIEDANYEIRDSTLLKKLGKIKVYGYLELYDPYGCELLYSQYHRDMRFILEDRVLLYGLAREEFMQNKLKELMITEVAENVPSVINRFEGPYIWRAKRKSLFTFMSLYYGPTQLEDPKIRQASIAPTDQE